MPVDERDELVEALGRRVGAELRSPAPERGATAIARRARGKRTAIALVAGCSVLAIVAIAVSVIGGRPDTAPDTGIGGPPTASTPTATAVAETAISTRDPSPNTQQTTTATLEAEPRETASTVAPTEFDLLPGQSTEIEPVVSSGLPTWSYSDDGTRLYELVGRMPDPAAWELIVRDALTLEVVERLQCPVSTSADGESRWSTEAASAWDDSARRLFGVTSRTRSFSAVFDVGCPVVFSADGSIAYHSLEETDRTALWDVSTGTSIVAQGQLFLDGYVAALSPDGSLLVTVDPNGPAGTRVWNARTGGFVRALNGVPGAASSASSRDDNVSALFTPDGAQLITAGTSIEVWSVGTWTKRYAIPIECPCSRVLDDGVTGTWIAAAVSPDGRYMAAMQGHATTVWDVSTGAELYRFEPRVAASTARFEITSLAFSPDGRFLLNELMDAHSTDESQFGEFSVGIHEVSSGAEVELPQVPGSGALPFRAALSPDGRSLALVTVTKSASGALAYQLQRWFNE